MKQQTNILIHYEKVVVKRQFKAGIYPRGYLITFPDGRTRWAANQRKALAVVKADAAGRTGSKIIVSQIEWQGVKRLIGK